MMTEQQIFNRVVNHLLNQGEKSTRQKDGICAYRGKNGLQCALGCLIDDKWYSVQYEGKSIGQLVSALAGNEAMPGVDLNSEGTVDLLEALQHVHDVIPIGQWRMELARVADEFGLRMPEIPK